MHTAALLTVEYHVPVLAIVNLATRVVERVIIVQDGIRLTTRHTPSVRTADGDDLVTDRATIAQAVQIAETGEWPAWEFEF